jgi:uncharacterized membrane protein
MTTIIKLLVAALILNAVAQASLAAYKSYTFEDSVHEALLFAPSAADADIIERIGGLADEQEVPLETSKINITRTPNEVRVQMSYVEDISLVPGIYRKAWTFNPSSSARILAGVSIPSKAPRRR